MPKGSLILLILLLSSCASIRAVRNTVLGDKNISSEEKLDYAKTIEGLNHEREIMKQQADEMRIYHYAAIACFGLGAFIIFIKKGNSMLGVGAIIFGVGLSGWAMYAPTHASQIGWGLLVVIAISSIYLAYILVGTGVEALKRRNNNDHAISN